MARSGKVISTREFKYFYKVQPGAGMEFPSLDYRRHKFDWVDSRTSLGVKPLIYYPVSIVSPTYPR